MKLSILIATQGRRNDQLRRLLAKLMPQVRKHKGEIEVVAYWNNGEKPIGIIRQELLEEARGEYVCFIDDDDDIPDYYCDEIIKALGKDYVGFQVQVFSDGVELKPSYHSLKHADWHETDQAFYRRVTHLNPVLTRMARFGTFTENGIGEDADWARDVSKIVTSENYIDKVMYMYHHDREDTSFGGAIFSKRTRYTRPELNYKHFRYHPSSKLSNKEE